MVEMVEMVEMDEMYVLVVMVDMLTPVKISIGHNKRSHASSKY